MSAVFDFLRPWQYGLVSKKQQNFFPGSAERPGVVCGLESGERELSGYAADVPLQTQYHYIQLFWMVGRFPQCAPGEDYHLPGSQGENHHVAVRINIWMGKEVPGWNHPNRYDKIC